MVVETVIASEVMGDSANVDDVVPALMSDTAVSVAEKRTRRICPSGTCSGNASQVNLVMVLAL